MCSPDINQKHREFTFFPQKKKHNITDFDIHRLRLTNYDNLEFSNVFFKHKTKTQGVS